MNSNTLRTYESANDYITAFWFSKHPFICLLNILVAKLSIKIMPKPAVHDENTEKFFKIALSIAKDSLGVGNLFYGNLAQDVGLYYLSSGNYFEGTRHLLMAYNVFREHRDEFYVDYMRVMKKLTKYFIVLGYYKEALEYGKELINNYINNQKKEKEMLKRFNIEMITLNVIKIAKILGNYEKGVELCKILIYDLQGGKVDLNKVFKIKNFKNWKYMISSGKNRSKRGTNGPSGTNNNGVNNSNTIYGDDKGIDINLKKVFKLYLKLIIRSLRDEQRIIYIQALVRIMEVKKERESLERYNKDVDALFDELFREIKDEGDFSKFFTNKILYHIGQKFEQERTYSKLSEMTNQEIEKNFEINWDKFKRLYKICAGSRVFTTFLDTDNIR
jgi:tetratricopeptide (TPR) repeat protein